MDAPTIDGSVPLARLRAEVAAYDRVVVAFSGGVDSALLARVAHDELGAGRVHVVTAVSPSLAADERDEAAALGPRLEAAEARADVTIEASCLCRNGGPIGSDGRGAEGVG